MVVLTQNHTHVTKKALEMTVKGRRKQICMDRVEKRSEWLIERIGREKHTVLIWQEQEEVLT